MSTLLSAANFQDFQHILQRNRKIQAMRSRYTEAPGPVQSSSAEKGKQVLRGFPKQ